MMCAIALEIQDATFGGENGTLGAAERIGLVQCEFGSIAFGNAVDEADGYFAAVSDLKAPLPEVLQSDGLSSDCCVGLRDRDKVSRVLRSEQTGEAGLGSLCVPPSLVCSECWPSCLTS